MKPLLLTKAVERTRFNEGCTDSVSDAALKPFHYDYYTDMNIRSGEPFIENGKRYDRELFTKTELTPERDDEEIKSSCFFHMETLTHVDGERDDEDDESFSLVELFSKTFEDRERDDEEDSYYY